MSDGISGEPVARVQRAVGRRLERDGWVLSEREPFGPAGVGTFGLPVRGDFAATMRVLHGLDDAGDGPPMLIAAGVIGLDYEPARKLTTALVGFAASGVVLREPHLVVKVAGLDDVDRATESLVGFALEHVSSLTRVATVDMLIEMLEEDRAVAASEAAAVLVDPRQLALSGDEPDLPDFNTQLITALLAGAGRCEEARRVLRERNPSGYPEGASLHHRRLLRQLTRWVDHDGTLPVPTTPAQWPPDWWETRLPKVEQSGGFLQFLAEHWPESRARTEALDAVRAVSAGKTRHELRELLGEELTKREVSMEPVSFEQEVDRLVTEREPFGKARLLLRGLAALRETGRQGHTILRTLEGESTARPGKRRDPAWMKSPERASYPLHLFGGERVAVELDPDAGAWLGEAIGADQAEVVRTRRVEVWLTSDSASTSAMPSVSVHIGSRCVGRLTGREAASFRPAIEAAAERDEDARGDAHLTRLPGGVPYVLDLPLPAGTETLQGHAVEAAP